MPCETGALVRRLLKAETRMCGIIRKSTAVQTWETTASLLHFAVSSQLGEECIVFLSGQTEESLVSVTLWWTFNTFQRQFADASGTYLFKYTDDRLITPDWRGEKIMYLLNIKPSISSIPSFCATWFFFKMFWGRLTKELCLELQQLTDVCATLLLLVHYIGP